MRPILALIRPLTLTLTVLSFQPAHLHATPSKPEIHFEVHSSNKLWLGISNWNNFGRLVYTPTNLFVGNYIGYPHQNGASQPPLLFEVGGIANRDTLVSGLFGEFMPPSRESPNYEGEKLVMNRSAEVEHAVEPLPNEITSCVYLDTLTNELRYPDALDDRDHRPMSLRVRQVTRTWSFQHVDDIVFITLELENIGHLSITDGYIGALLWGESVARSNSGLENFVYSDDLVGFLDNCFSHDDEPLQCKRDGCLGLMWHADNDGDPNYEKGAFDNLSVTAAMGVCLVDAPAMCRTLSFNWAHLLSESREDFRPQRHATGGSHRRVIETAFGDRDVYHELSNGEIDYDQAFTTIDHTPDGWEPPPMFAVDHDTTSGRGTNQQILQRLSAGPFTLNPGETLPFTFAYLGAENFHTNPRNLIDNFDPQDPQKFYDGLNFDELIKNATWAGWTYDNPGYDTDLDGYRGQYHECQRDSVVVDTVLVIDSLVLPYDSLWRYDTLVNMEVTDTIYYSGDGIPDWRPVSPPISPEFRVMPSEGEFVVEWNGLITENTPDIFTNQKDFEGYRVYVGLAPNRRDMSLVSSYDKLDYTQYYFNSTHGLGGSWEVIADPFSLRDLQVRYAGGNIHFDPLSTSRENPLRSGDSAFYFLRTDWNQSDYRDTTRIHKIYPDEPHPHTLNLGEGFTHDTLYVDPITHDSTFYSGGELTPDGKHFKYYEYRLVIKNLLPSTPYYSAVTAFDYGSAELGVGALETDRARYALESVAQDTVAQNPANGLDILVYPNPYRIDENYRDDGFEGRIKGDYPEDFTRAVHFSGLPPVCRIEIYSLDGDLIWFTDHNSTANSPNAMHDSWNVITRNRQLPTSGLYYWVVTTPTGLSQVGKLVLVM